MNTDDCKALLVSLFKDEMLPGMMPPHPDQKVRNYPGAADGTQLHYWKRAAKGNGIRVFVIDCISKYDFDKYAVVIKDDGDVEIRSRRFITENYKVKLKSMTGNEIDNEY
jgi:hypothetical protein